MLQDTTPAWNDPEAEEAREQYIACEEGKLSRAKEITSSSCAATPSSALELSLADINKLLINAAQSQTDYKGQGLSTEGKHQQHARLQFQGQARMIVTAPGFPVAVINEETATCGPGAN